MSEAARWAQIHVASRAPEPIENWLIEAGALAVSLSDAADSPIFEPAPGEIRTWPETIVTGLFDGDID
ncbi:MAG: 50S ribosomal protein L11 methyltransferase, partial [Oceanococcus sp.]